MRVGNHLPIPNPQRALGSEGAGRVFGQVLSDAIYSLNQDLNAADQAAKRLITGDIEFHDAMIITEKANLALQLTMAVRTKVMEAYQEIMRMQV